ncbi:MAG: hypothetical protein GXP55_11125 [Deltaproteobacteria bacterium]|nr:hypothetical protein [Deltaproteobacteria bacterium]
MNRGVARSGLMILFVAMVAACGDMAPPYARCGGSDDCNSEADTCYRLRFQRGDGTEADGRFCSQGCDAETLCPEGGVCLALTADASGTMICYAPCDVAEDCYAGLRCTPVDGADVASVCMP